RDLELVARPLDFLGVNYYAPVRVAPGTGPLPVRYLPPEGPVTAMGWEVYPKGLYHLLKHLGREVPWPLYITENGAAYPDLWTGEAVVEDPERVAYLEAHVEAAWRALDGHYPALPVDQELPDPRLSPHPHADPLPRRAHLAVPSRPPLIPPPPAHLPTTPPPTL
ncbi:family 1 glycosylhydrolase, partial [Thermus scotoductus]|uniref:family 1 glycosylhydrolase n=1 Tax=Thermus scotoductus TaxID=37636 RepID=UPI0020A55FAB